MQTFTKEQFWTELDEAGEDVVRERVIGKKYGDGNHKLALAQEWLRLQEQKRIDAATAANNALNAENIRIARSAKNAAWVAAVCAIVAIVVSILGSM